MRIISGTSSQIFLGKKGENLATQVVFPCVKQWKKDYGDGQFQLIFQRLSTESPYAVTIVTDEENVMWNVTNTDVDKPGNGKAELQYYVTDENDNQILAKSATFLTKVVESLDNAGGTPPEPWESWVEQVLAAASTAEDYAEDAQGYANDAKGYKESAEVSATEASGYVTDAHAEYLNAKEEARNASDSAASAYASELAASSAVSEVVDMTVEATTLTPGSQATVEKSGGSGAPLRIVFGIPDGIGIASITKTGTSGNVDTYTITYTNGSSTTYTVTNGQDAAIDATLSHQGEAADAKVTGDKITDIRDMIDPALGYTDISPATTAIEAKVISVTGGVISYGNSTTSSTVIISGIVPGDIITYRRTGLAWGNCCFFDNTMTPIQGSTFTTPATTDQTVTVPPGASYAGLSAITARINNLTATVTHTVTGTIYTALDAKLDKDQTAANAGKILYVGSDGMIIPKDSPAYKHKYMIDAPVKGMYPEMMADFAWCAMRQPAALTGINVVITVSGSTGDEEITASAISGVTYADLGTDWIGGVISADGVNFKVVNFKYVSGTTIKIFPALTEDISGGVLSNLIYDSGPSYVGLHLTENGYKAWAQNLYAKNPKHCEIGKYIERVVCEAGATSPFTWYGGNIYADTYSENPSMNYLRNPSQAFFRYSFPSTYTPHTTRSGCYWEVDLKGKSGYLEAYIFAYANPADIKLSAGQKFHIDVIIDGVTVQSEYVEDAVCRRVICDYTEAHTGRLEIWSDDWSGTAGWGICDVYWWENELEYPDQVLFPAGAVIAQEFDSWGVFHNGASAAELERLHNAASGVSVPYTNHSKGDQTTAWGLSWWYENIKKYDPSMCVTDFLVNDSNSQTSPGIPATIDGPDGVSYNNKLTAAQYSDNIKRMELTAVRNRIQPVLTRNTQSGSSSYYRFAHTMIALNSEQ